MADYAIGDVQGCYDALLRLLELVHFDDKQDRLWFVGDLVNRGPDSLSVLRFIKQLSRKPCIVLGNHDIHFLHRLYNKQAKVNRDDTLSTLLDAPDREELGDWLRQQPLLIHDENLNVVMCHAGIAPMWDLTQAKRLAHEFETMLSGESFRDYLPQLYGNQPDHWSDALAGAERLRLICNYFTRMRFCDKEGRLALDYKGSLAQAPTDLYPWYALPNRRMIHETIIFGHWAALQGKCPIPGIHAIDTGYVWGGALTALRLSDKQRFTVK